jgi:hypothetical protein
MSKRMLTSMDIHRIAAMGRVLSVATLRGSVGACGLHESVTGPERVKTHFGALKFAIR